MTRLPKTRLWRRSWKQRSASSAERCDREDDGVELLDAPQLREVEANRRRVVQPAGLDSFDEPGQSAFDGWSGVGSCVEQHFHGQRRLLDARRGALGAAPAAVIVLVGEQPGDAAPCGFFLQQTVEITVGSKHAGSPVGWVLVVVGVLVAEPQRQPRSVSPLLPLHVLKATEDELEDPLTGRIQLPGKRRLPLNQLFEHGPQRVGRKITARTVER